MKDKIIVIEDEVNVRENIVTLLKEEGYAAYPAENGYDGIELIKNSDPDLVLCDIIMEGIDGYDVLKITRNIIDKPVPFIFLTAKVDSTDLRKGMELGADDYLFKPFKVRELLAAVKTRLINQQKNEKYYSSPKENSNTEKVDNKEKNYKFQDKILLKIGNEPKFISIKDIKVILAENQYSKIILSNNNSFLLKKSLNKWENNLPSEHFLRIHRSTIINTDFINNIESWFKNTYKIKIKGLAKDFIISRRNAAKLKLFL